MRDEKLRYATMIVKRSFSSFRFGLHLRAVRLVQTVSDHLDELFEVEGFEDRVADRVGGDLFHASLAGGGEDNDVRPDVWIGGRDALDELVAIEARHHEIEEDEIESAVRLQ